jgi:hypothetical protein
MLPLRDRASGVPQNFFSEMEKWGLPAANGRMKLEGLHVST